MSNPEVLMISLFLVLFLFRPTAGGSSIVFATLGRARYAFDIFSLPNPLLSSDTIELRLTDGQSVNYNGYFPAVIRRPDSDPNSHPVVYVSERNGSSNVYSTRPSKILESIPLLPESASMKDRPILSGEHLVYVSTHVDSMPPRKSWAAVYSTHLPTGSTRRLTPVGISDMSPAVSPSGEWTAVASSGETGWTGEVEELKTGIFVFRTRDGSERVKVVDHGGWPSWSEDDSSLYFHRKSDDGWWSVYRATIVRIPKVVGVVERVTPPGFHAFTPAVGKGFVVMATRRSSSRFRHIEVLDLERNVFVELTNRVSPRFHHYNPFVSPDSERIGYHRCRGNGNSGGLLILENIKSVVPETSLFRIDGSFPSFSPDGNRIAYAGFPGLYVVNSDGSGHRKVLSDTVFATGWDWKRKGVIYTSRGPTFAEETTEVDLISVTIPDGDDASAPPSVKKLTIGGKNNAFPSASPDGKWVVFRSGRSGHKNLYIMDAVEGEKASLRQLTDGPWTDTMCNWSPDGEWIAFASDRHNPGGGSFKIYFIHPNGTGLRLVVESGDGGRTNHPFFSPDSKSFVFTTDYAAVSAEPISNPHHYQPYGDIFTARIDGTGLRRLTHNSYEDGTPTWGPAFMKAANVPESLQGVSQCKFDDCHWLAQQVGSHYTPLKCSF